MTDPIVAVVGLALALLVLTAAVGCARTAEREARDGWLLDRCPSLTLEGWDSYRTQFELESRVAASILHPGDAFKVVGGV